jgi:hypothetical protein
MPSGKGGLFNIGYWRLSYRGRFPYDLWMTPIGAAAAAGVIWWWFRPADVTGYWFVGLLVLVGVASATNNYLRWQAQARGEKPDAEPGAAADTAAR